LEAVLGLRRLLVPVVAVLALLWLVPTAEGARIAAKTSLTQKAGATRIVAKLTSARTLSARARPRAVSVKAGRRLYKLKRAAGAGAAAVSLGTWRSGAYRGAAARTLLRQAGKRVAVRIGSRAGTTIVRSKLVAPTKPAPVLAPEDDGEVPSGDDQPTGDSPPPTGTTGDITGQAAIDKMTAEISDGAVRRFASSGDLSETFELHLCSDGAFRHYHHQSYIGVGPTAVERSGNPWKVVEALIRGDGSYRGARVQGTFTQRNSLNGGQQAINEPAEALLEFTGGQWYWDKQPVETLQASCGPSF
jgi:hypothetical protein